MINITANSRAAREKLANLQRGLTQAATEPLVNEVAWRTHAALVEKTPKRYTGQTRRSWSVQRAMGSKKGYLVSNSSKVMLFLEAGTKAHGPVTKKFLYIPLNRNAAIGGWNPKLVLGVDYILTKRVRGIKAMRIVAKQRPKTQRWMAIKMRKHVRKLLSQ